MSRIGKRPVTVASGIDVSLDGTTLVAKKGNLEKRLETHGRVGIKIDGNEVTFERIGNEKQDAAYWEHTERSSTTSSSVSIKVTANLWRSMVSVTERQ